MSKTTKVQFRLSELQKEFLIQLGEGNATKGLELSLDAMGFQEFKRKFELETIEVYVSSINNVTGVYYDIKENGKSIYSAFFKLHKDTKEYISDHMANVFIPMLEKDKIVKDGDRVIFIDNETLDKMCEFFF